ncbi:Phenylalanine--tRNA ligase alpha subunit [Candidatus Portiera aleyrodidarum]|uniref:Phenylalanine--tRNA ligase alpha subunit n=1 Tax=Candidatus Portiera aleyrodidarum TV TaxID=1297582 RepID=A0A8D4BUH8_9GAMM|nr:phenylalanine--tRNA ligase subunit alpha [Candidatus Portiera aleyrodidarum]AGI27057.1 phenylalanyl-tRNA synthetase, alpha subunit [Candidatus Portiera aleyrodidarum TV]CEI59018.1 Phenylalanine--tRNA ligase alpha subunit [Candidatus Portiera aleyrodidarum]
MFYNLIKLVEEANIKINAANNINKLNEIRIQYFGKKGKLTLQLKHISNLKSYDKPIIGEAINKTKKNLYKKFKYHNNLLEKETIKNKIAKEKIDVTLPGRGGSNIGNLHPITRTLYRIKKIFITIGYKLVDGPEIEDEFHNFEALNMPRNHPARAMHDTFYFNSNYMLRSHTSSILIRTMEKQNPPFRVIGAGKVYRCDSDLNHSPMFHQVEGLLVDEFVSFSDLKGTIDMFIKGFFEGQKIEVRFRPSYFPFTEPSAEVDIRIKHYSDWLEVIGCGMIHPNILKRLKINPKYYGFAFGMGAERLTMLRYGIKDLRTLFNNDIRIWRQF